MIIGEALQSARPLLNPVANLPNLEAQLLLCEVLGVERSYLLAHPEQPLTPEQQAQYTALVRRRAVGEPLPYILGRRAFYDREFTVTPSVLIPRPETELLLEQALIHVQARPDAHVVDVGTGSGALAVTLAALHPQARVYATDISPVALEIARHNAARHQAAVTFYEGDLLLPLVEQHIQVEVVMANLPYVASDEVPQLAVSQYEPLLALDGGGDGLDIIRRLLNQIPQVCTPGALVLLEIGAEQGEAALALVQEKLTPQQAEIFKDYADLNRIVRVIV